MNALIPHRAVYLHEAERNLQLCAKADADALLARVRQYDTSGCAECDDIPAATRWITAALAGLYLVVLIGSAALALGWHGQAVQGLLSVLRGQP